MVSSESASSTVYEQIRQLILTNVILPDAKLNMDAIARDLGVSQTPVREALGRLEGDRLVVAKRSPRGYWTTPLLDERELEHLFEVRLLIEPWAAGIAAADRASNPGARLRQSIDEFERDQENHPTGRYLVGHDTDFHNAIFRAVGNPFLAEAFDRTHAHLHLFRLYQADLDARVTVEEHRRIADAIERCDAAAATDAMRGHLLSALARFGRGLDTAGAERRLQSTETTVLGSDGEAAA